MGEKKTDSPCYTCEHKDRNKNSVDCVNCERRIKYATEERMIFDESANERKEEKVEITCVDCDSTSIQAKKRCAKHYMAWRKANPDKIKKRQPKKDPKYIFGSRIRREEQESISHQTAVKAVEEAKERQSLTPDKEKEGGRKHRNIKLYAHVEIDPEKYELLAAVSEIARWEYRTIQNQAFYFLKKSVEEWRRQEKNK